jgi:hypothetical protein
MWSKQMMEPGGQQDSAHVSGEFPPARFTTPLQQLAYEEVARSFAKRPVELQKLPESQADAVVSLLPLDLPLDIAARYVASESYWCSRCFAQCEGSMSGSVSGSSSSWKQLFFERALSHALSSQPLSLTQSSQDLRFPSAHLNEGVSTAQRSARPSNEVLNHLTECARFVHALSMRVNPGETGATVSKLHALDGHVSKLALSCAASDVGMEYDRRLFGMTEQDCSSFCSFIVNSVSLTRLDLSNNRLDDQLISQLAHALSDNFTVGCVSLAHNRVGDHGAEKLAGMLCERPDVWKLDLSDNNIADDGAQSLATTLQSKSSVSFLNLKLNRISDRGASAIIASLEHSTCSVASLVLAANDDCVGDATTAALTSSIPRSESLTDLDISGNDIANSNGRKLMEALEGSTMLQHVEVERCNLSDDVSRGIVNITQRNRSRCGGIDSSFGEIPESSLLMQMKAQLEQQAQERSQRVPAG